MGKRTRAQQPQYRLLIAPHTNERTYRPTTLVVLETAQSFAAFRYELSVEEKIEEKALTYRIRGLRAPSLDLPAAGRAAFRKEYSDLHGTYTVSVIGLDGAATECTVKISPKKVVVLKPPTGRSLSLITEQALLKD
jgi:hypothetical protein